MDNKKCKQCGVCCKKFCITLCEEDFYLWENAGRDDILAVAHNFELGDFRIGDGFIRKGADDPTPDGVKSCLFLMFQPHNRKFVCRINDVKPAICREYFCNKD